MFSPGAPAGVHLTNHGHQKKGEPSNKKQGSVLGAIARVA